MKGGSLRLRLFVALSGAALLGALATGLYAVALDAQTMGFPARLLSVLPKAFALASAFVPLSALAAALVGRRLARPVEELADAAARIAEGERTARVPRGDAGEAEQIGHALRSLARELADQPYAAAFLRDAWHDLKTPLAAIRATVEVLEDGAVDDPTLARRFVANLARSTGDLDARLSDLVTLARFETGALRRDRATAMSGVIATALSQVEPLARAKGVLLRRDDKDDDRLRGDPAALIRAIGNLVENAVDATPGGSVLVAVDGKARDAVIVEVVNEPASVPLDMRGSLWQRAATARPGRGSGLGLPIARAAIEAHGGRVQFVELGPPRVRVRVELPR